MPLKNTKETFGAIAKFLHWIIAALIIANFVTEYFMHSLPVSDLKWWFYDLHKSLGITALGLIAFRIFWRLNNAPPHPITMQLWQQKASGFNHAALYLAMIIMPITGFIGSKAGGHKAMWFGMFDMPDLFGKNMDLNWWAEIIHTYTSKAIIVLVGVHVAAALFHHFIQKDEVLTRMLPFAKHRQPTSIQTRNA